MLVGCFLAIFALLLGVSWIYWGLKERKLIKLRAKLFVQNGGLLLQQQLAHVKGSTETAKILTAEELKRATNNYEESRVLGQGGYGTVCKGVLKNNSVVAIKKSTIGNQSQIEQFINEIVVLSQINHRNVVKLVGCCLESKVPLLVYEFITNGTLYDHIHDKLCKFIPLSWDMRLQIATETAGAVAYLHSSASMPIIRRDIITANILLDENCTAKVSDFGASRLVPLDHTEITTLVQGTLGYLDPENIHTSQLTAKSDVYSFGVVLAELLTGQKALSFNRPECDASLAMFFVTSLKEDRVLEIIDKDVITEENVDQLKPVSNIARSCLRVRGEDRPTMKEVAGELEELKHKGMHPWEEDDSSSSEETDSLLYPYGDKNGDTIGSSTGTTTISTTTCTFDSINVQSLKPSDDDAR